MIQFRPSDPRFDGGCNACRSMYATRALEVGLDPLPRERLPEGTVASGYVSSLRFCDACLLDLAQLCAAAVGTGRRRIPRP